MVANKNFLLLALCLFAPMVGMQKYKDRQYTLLEKCLALDRISPEENLFFTDLATIKLRMAIREAQQIGEIFVKSTKPSQNIANYIKDRLSREPVNTIVELYNSSTDKIKVFTPYIAHKLIQSFALNPEIYNAKDFPFSDVRKNLANTVCSLPVYDKIRLQNACMIESNGKAAFSAVISPNSNYVVIASNDQNTKDYQARIYTISDINNIKQTSTITFSDQINSAAFSPNNNYLVIGTGNKVTFLDMTTNKSMYYTECLIGITAAVFSPDNKYLLITSIGGTAVIRKVIKITDPESMGHLNLDFKCFIEEQSSYGSLYSPMFRFDGKQVLIASMRGQINIYDIVNGCPTNNVSNPKNTISYKRESLSSVEWSPDGKYILIVFKDGQATICDTAGKIVHDIQQDSFVNSAFFNPNGEQVVTVSSDGTVKIYTINEQNIQLTDTIKHTEKINLARFSSDGRYLVIASDDGTVQIQPLNLCGMPDLQVLAVATLIEQAGYKKAGKTIKPLLQDGWVYKAVMQLQPEERGRLFGQYKETKELVEPSRFRQVINFIKSYLGN